MKILLSFILLTTGCYGTKLRFPRPDTVLARLRRSTQCAFEELDSRTEDFSACIDSTTVAFSMAVDNLDGRPDFLERKICNAMEEMMNCFVQVLPCFPKQMQEDAMATQLASIKGIVQLADNFDEDKCPYYTWFKGGYKTQPDGVPSSNNMSSSSDVVAPFLIKLFIGLIFIMMI